MSSLSEYERRGLEEVFLCLGEKPTLSEKINEQTNRLFSGLSTIAKKRILTVFPLAKSKKIMFGGQRKVEKFKLFNHFRPKNRGSK